MCETLGWSRLNIGDPSNLEAHPLRCLRSPNQARSDLSVPRLCGPKATSGIFPAGTPKAYLALTREDARREKQGLGSGGTYGLGKAVLWAASSVQTVVFFLGYPLPRWDDTSPGRAGSTGSTFLNNQPYRGLGYGGDRRDGGVDQ